MITYAQATETIGQKGKFVQYRNNAFHAPYPGNPRRCVRMKRNGKTLVSGNAARRFVIPVMSGMQKGMLSDDLTTEVFIADQCPRCHPDLTK